MTGAAVNCDDVVSIDLAGFTWPDWARAPWIESASENPDGSFTVVIGREGWWGVGVYDYHTVTVWKPESCVITTTTPAPAPTAPPTTVVVGVTPPPSTVVTGIAPPPVTLPRTGDDGTVPAVGLGLVLLVVGGLTALWRWRDRRRNRYFYLGEQS